ncbi:MAG: NAD-dependent epimerase/dehydratase family protein [Steroidobacteraceae bacterium]|jgi:NAD(P)-dependent dehydrogenase (short-subunit alcohol dehydrogenase family)
MSAPVRIVVIGGCGNFGARICRRLMPEAGLEIVATSRAEYAVGPGGARTARLDLDSASFTADLAALHPDIVIHCAGPFQGQDYRVALASLACGAHYLDLADAREFVARFAAALDAPARTAHRVALSGASTLPALSSAVVDHFSAHFEQLESIEMYIAPGQHAPRGAATMAAVLSYAGRPFRWMIGGGWQTVHGWQALVRVNFVFGRRWAAACDVPDLELFPRAFPGVRTVTFRAALEVASQHWALWALAGLRRAGLPLPLSRWAAGFNRLGTWLNRFGSACGGMRVDLGGQVAGRGSGGISWQLIARGNHGPEIPCIAAILMALKLARGAAVPEGAGPCLGLLSLPEFETEFARWDIRMQVQSTSP